MEPFREMINGVYAEHHDSAFPIVLNDSYFRRNVERG